MTAMGKTKARLKTRPEDWAGDVTLVEQWNRRVVSRSFSFTYKICINIDFIYFNFLVYYLICQNYNLIKSIEALM